MGTSRGLKGFDAHHQITFLRTFPDRKVANHIANVYDGNYVITGGWPSVVATHSGPDWLNTGCPWRYDIYTPMGTVLAMGPEVHTEEW